MTPCEHVVPAATEPMKVHVPPPDAVGTHIDHVVDESQRIAPGVHPDPFDAAIVDFIRVVGFAVVFAVDSVTETALVTLPVDVEDVICTKVVCALLDFRGADVLIAVVFLVAVCDADVTFVRLVAALFGLEKAFPVGVNPVIVYPGPALAEISSCPS